MTGRLAPLVFLLAAGCGLREQETPLPDPPEVPLPERGTYLHIVAPSIVGLGEEAVVRLRCVTHGGLPNYDFEGAFRFEASSGMARLENLRVEAAPAGFFRARGITLQEPGVQFLRGIAPGDTVQAVANAINVRAEPTYRILWGDLNGHSDLSSGTTAPGMYYWYARAVALLDFAVLTDNDRESSLGKTLDAAALADLQEAVQRAGRPGEFTALAGFEWTSRGYGNRIVIFQDPPQSIPSVAAGVDTPGKLRDALPAGTVVVVAHPSGSRTGAPADPASVETEDLVEIYSTRGSFEGPGTPRPTSRETPGASVGHLLRAGRRLGVVATSDTKASMPGNPRAIPVEDHPWPGGLTAVLARENTAPAILDALRARRCYATTGERVLMEFTVDGAEMGSVLTVPSGHRARVYGSLGGTSRWARVEISGPEGPIASLAPASPEDDVVEIQVSTDPVTGPTFVALRGIDERGGIAWSSPVFLAPE